MPRDFASMMRFSIWSLMPRPWRPPIVLASSTRATASWNSTPLMATGRPCSHRTVTSSVSIATDGSQNRDAHDRLDDLHRLVEELERLRLVGGAPDVGVGRVGLLGGGAVGQVARRQPLGHLVAAAELGDEVGVEPRLVDAQLGVGQRP